MASLLGMKKKQDTVKTKKPVKIPVGPLYLSDKHVNAVLITGDVRRIVKQPKYVEANEWLAASTFDFFNHVNLFSGTVSEYCTPKDCPSMTAGECYEYLWTDQDRKAQHVSASQYIDYVMTWLNAQLSDETAFPTRAGQEFPKDFVQIIKLAFKRMFRVLAHIYHSHYDKIVALQVEAHLNTLFVHFVSFALEFDLIEKKELAPMMDLISHYVNTKLISSDMLKDKS